MGSPKFIDSGHDPLLVREKDLCGSVRADPPLPGLLPFSRATLWRKVKSRDFPQPIRISSGITAWRLRDVEDWISRKAA